MPFETCKTKGGGHVVVAGEESWSIGIKMDHISIKIFTIKGFHWIGMAQLLMDSILKLNIYNIQVYLGIRLF
jgi:hypothetical protein